ncbi:MAG TPA: hypothetical protein VEB21_14375, partial [Terriglobales bacterium]|nr:hypothetical protein [Terriglobales bacterium]
MIAVDTNILVYAHRAEMPLHEPALRRLRQLAEGNRPWALPGLAPALEFLEHLLASPSARLLLPGPAYPTLFAEACRDGTARGNLAFDAQIA